MQVLRYRIAPEVFEAHPDYVRGVLVFDRLDNRGDGAALVPLLREAERQLRDTVAGNVAEHPRIAAWREAYRRFGAKPSEHRSSIEAMVRRVVQPGEIPSINPLVNIGNIVSLRHRLPAGVHPLSHGHDALELRAALPPDVFTPADGKPAESPPPGEIVFVAGHEVLTRRWTWRQARGTQTLPETTRVFFNIDGLPPATDEQVLAAMDDVAALVQAHCGGVRVVAVRLDAAQPQLATDLP
ncbi:phenylalanine--tRNA ligase beta subunit-related protein [Comamonadaceae bacterium G21597-S1]|nr:phenylalanine--tRNA ligase beta subunit-related protein [Comamonadaceae bacterium G21597-S1]